MADTSTGIPQDDIQDLQINLAANEQKEENLPKTKEEIKNEEPELDLNLDLDLPDAPKNDDRLRIEDQKNNEIPEQNEIPTIPMEKEIVEPILIDEKIIDLPSSEPAIEPTTEETTQQIPMEPNPQNETTEEQIKPIESSEPIPEIPTTENTTNTTIEETNTDTKIPETEATIQEENKVATIIEEIPSSSDIIWENPPEKSSLQEDMKMIQELEWHGAGGLAVEAIIPPQQTPTENEKTFDLDAMLGNPTIPTTTESIQTTNIPATENIPSLQAKENIQVQTANIPSVINSPIIPSITTQVPVQAISQTSIPQKKNAGVKVFLFLIMFVGLGFTTFFILKTMYPIELGNMLSGTTTTTGDENITGTELTGIATTTEITGTDTSGTDISWTDITWINSTGTEAISGITETGIGTDMHGSATGDANFWELNSLVTTPTPEPTPVADDVSKLTDYVNQGTTLLAEGRKIGNSKIIMFGLYISKKGTTFLEKIANGEKIDTLGEYFAQSDKYLLQAKELIGPLPTPSTTEPIVSPTPQANDSQSMTPDTTTSTPQNSWVTAE